MVVVAICGLVIILVILGVGIFYMLKRCNKRGIADSTTIQPFEGKEAEMSQGGGANRNRAKIGDAGMSEEAIAAGALTVKKRKAKKKGKHMPDNHAVAATDDDAPGI